MTARTALHSGGQAVPAQSTGATVLSAASGASSPTVQVTNNRPVREMSGTVWTGRYPTSTSLDDLVEPFRGDAKKFISAMRTAGATVNVSATYRPVERSYLMHYCAEIARGNISPERVQTWSGVNIDWAHIGADGHADLQAARAAAESMKSAYGIGHNPVAAPGRSNHNGRQALDMSIHGYEQKSIVDGDGKTVLLRRWSDLVDVGESYGVIWFGAADRPHWSLTGR